MCASARRSSKLAKCTWRRRGPRSAGSPWGVLSRGGIRAMRRATRRGWLVMPPGVPQPYPPAVEGVQGFRASSVRRHWRWAPRLSHSTGGYGARALARGTCARSHTRLACFRAHVSLAWLSKNTCMTSGLRLELIASVRRHTACAALLAHEDVRDCGLPPTAGRLGILQEEVRRLAHGTVRRADARSQEGAGQQRRPDACEEKHEQHCAKRTRAQRARTVSNARVARHDL